jgi:hypothetical protein
MALLLIILFVTNVSPVRVYKDNKRFPKNSQFHFSFNQENDVYVKIYETAQLTMFHVF